MTITTEFIQTNNVRLHVAADGEQNAPLVILLHGFPEFWYGWRRQIEPLARAGFRVIAPDQRGYNLSDKPDGIAAYTIDTLTRDVIGVLDALGREKCFLVGHDWGGSVAWWTANKYPERLEKLAVLNTPHHRVFAQALRQDLSQRRKSAYIRFFWLRGLPEITLRFANFALLEYVMRRSAKPNTFSPEDMRRYKTAWVQTGALTAMLNWYRAIRLNRASRPPDPQIHVPTLMLMSKQDRFFNWPMAEASIKLCDEGRLEYFEDSTHWLQHEEAERVNASLVAFFGG